MRIWFFRLLVVMVGSLMLSGCGTVSSPGEATEVPIEPIASEEPTAASTATPVPPTEVTLCAAVLPASLYDDDPAAVAIRDLVGGRAAVFGQDFIAEPVILTELPAPGSDDLIVNEDGTITVTLRYRDDLVWSDGEPFSADDAKLGLILPSGAYTPAFEVLDSEVVDTLTLRVTVAGTVEYPYVPNQMPLPAHLIDEGSAADAGEANWLSASNSMLTTTLGPYLLEENRESGATFVPNPASPTAGRIDRVNVELVDDVSARLADGTCDVALDGSLTGHSLADLASAATDGGWTLVQRSGFLTEQIWFNSYVAGLGRPAYFADVRVRQAAASAIDRALLSEEVFGQSLPLLDSWIPPGHWAYLSGIEPTYPYSPDDAETLLDAAGWRDEDGDGLREYQGEGGTYGCQRGSWAIADGMPLSPVLVIPAGDGVRAAEAARIAAGLNAVGMDVTIQEQDPATLYGIDGALVQRQFDLALLAGLGRPDPHGISRWVGAAVYLNPITDEVVHSWELPDFGNNTEFIVERLAADNTPGAGNDFTGQNYGGWCDEAANLAIVQADAIWSFEERMADYGAHQLRFAADVPALPLYVRPLVGASATQVCGIEAGPYDALTWNIADWWIDESGACEG